MPSFPKAVRGVLRIFPSILGVAVLTTLLAGCETTGSTADGANSSPPANGKYRVIADRAPFYQHGPAQGYGADANLVKGVVVTMLERKYGFSRVLTNYGEGWMATTDLEPAPQEEIEPVAVAADSTSAIPGSSTSSEPTYDEPTYPEPPDLELPEPTEPRPTFRY